MHIEWKRRFIIVGIVIGVYAGYRYLLSAAIPFLAAWLLAAWLYPLCVKIEKATKIRKTAAGVILLALLLGVLGFFLYLGVMELLQQIRVAIANWPVLMGWLDALLDNCCSALEKMAGIKAADSRTYIVTCMSDIRKELLASVSPGAAVQIFSCARDFVLVLSGVVVAFIVTILVIGDMDNIRKKIREYSWMTGMRHVIKRLKGTTVTYLKAQVIIMALVAVVCAAGLWLMGNQYFLILGLALGVLDALPIIGTGTFLYPAAVIYLIHGNTSMAFGCVMLDVVTSFLREFLEPRLLGDRLGVSPILVLASVYVGLFLYGAPGVVLGPLSFSTVYEIGREWDVWD